MRMPIDASLGNASLYVFRSSGSWVSNTTRGQRRGSDNPFVEREHRIHDLQGERVRELPGVGIAQVVAQFVVHVSPGPVCHARLRRW